MPLANAARFRRRRGVIIDVTAGRQEIVATPHGLDKNTKVP